MNNKFLFSFVIPTYNEARNLEILLPELVRLFLSSKFEIIIVDDGSDDDTVQVIEKNKILFPDIVLKQRGSLMGIGSALIDGYDMARGEYIISCDADLSFSFDGIKNIAEKLMSGKYDMVLGSRYIRGAYYEAPNFNILKKKIVSKLGNIFLRVTSGVPVHDFSANCRGIRNSTWKNLKVENRDNFMLFETIWRVHRAGGSVAEVPVKFLDRRFGSSKLKLGTIFLKFFSQLFKLYFLNGRQR